MKDINEASSEPLGHQPSPRKPVRRGSGPATRHAILKAATSLFCEQGFHGTSISDVADRAGVTGAALYYHFENKQEILLRVLESTMERFLVGLEALDNRQSPHVLLEDAIRSHVAIVIEHRDAVAVFLRERRFLDSPLNELYQSQVERYDLLFTRIISDGVTTGDLRMADVRVTSMLILGTINSTIEWFTQGTRLTGANLSDLIVDLLLYGVIPAVPTDLPDSPAVSDGSAARAGLGVGPKQVGSVGRGLVAEG